MPTQPLIVGNPVLVVVDMQEGGAMSADVAGIPVMPGHTERVVRAEQLVAAARTAGVPVVFFQEVHRPSGVDFGRELDGTEGVHCVEGQPGTDLEPSLRPGPDEFHIVKRRYSGFIGTDFEIVLRGLNASTLILIGGLTDVCVHYTFADAHQRDFYVRVVSDCVGGSSQYLHDAALTAMEYLQTGAVRTTDEILTALAECRRQRGSDAECRRQRGSDAEPNPILEGAAR
ncbi:MAG: biuret amidohydrolase [Mycobacterium sp.]|nr:biuret amidohydrolase [Mycobacterium sp.]